MTGSLAQASWKNTSNFASELTGVFALKVFNQKLYVGAKNALAVYLLPKLSNPTALATDGTIVKMAFVANALFALLLQNSSYKLVKFSLTPLKQELVLDAPVYDFDVDDTSVYVVTNSSHVAVFSQKDFKQTGTYNLSPVQYCAVAVVAKKVLCVASGGEGQNVVEFYSPDGTQKLARETTKLGGPDIRKTAGGNFLITDANFWNPKQQIELFSSSTYCKQTTIDNLFIPGGATDFCESQNELFFAGSGGIYPLSNSASLEKQVPFTLSSSYFPYAVVAIDNNTVFSSAGEDLAGINVWQKSETNTGKE
jgi:hypothetical protein